MTTVTAASPARWRDGKRYAWLLGVVVPTLPFIVYGLVHLTVGRCFGSGARS